MENGVKNNAIFQQTEALIGHRLGEQFEHIAGCFEVLFTFCMGKVKETTGTEMYLWFTGFLIATLISMLLLVKATHNLPIGTAYAVWTGIGAVGTVLVGILVFKEPAGFWRL